MAKAVVAGWGIAAFLGGVVAAGLHFKWELLAVAVILVLASLGRRFRMVFLITASGLVCGAFYYHAYFAMRSAEQKLPLPGEELTGIVASEPAASGTAALFMLALQEPFHGTIQVVAEGRFAYGDKLRLRGRIEPQAAERDLPVIKFPALLEQEAGYGNGMRAALISFRYAVLAPARRYLPFESAAYLEGLLLGFKNDFTAALKNDMKKSGTTHLVALSGYNVSIIVLAIQKVLLGRMPRRMNFWLTTSLLALFTLMVGAEPSILRAAIMGVLFLAAFEMGRVKSFGNALLWTAFAMLVFDPGALFTPGFLLSYLSLLGIVYLSPALLASWKVKEGSRFHELASHAALTLAAQIAVLPVLLVIFGNISLLSFFANLVILPFIPMTMLSGFILLASGSILPAAAPLIAKITDVLLALELGAIHGFARWSRPVMVTRISPVFIVLYYAVLAAYAAYALPHGKKEA